MKTTDRLLLASREIWEGYHRHPFVRGIADGSLDPEKFQFYMVQDYLYLLDYARVFALGVAKAPDEESMKLFAGYVHQIFYGEMDIHRAYMARIGISEETAQRVGMSLDNRSYTGYMLKVAYEGDAARIAAAILSCALSYEVIARRMTQENPNSALHPFYGEWVSGYANEEYHAANEVLIDLTNKLSAGYGEAEYRALEEIFLTCSRYEAAFWDMAWEMRE